MRSPSIHQDLSGRKRAGSPRSPDDDPLTESTFDDQLLTYRDLAHVLQMSAVTLRRYVSRGEIPHVKIGACVRFDRDAISRYIASHSRESKKPGGSG